MADTETARPKPSPTGGKGGAVGGKGAKGGGQSPHPPDNPANMETPGNLEMKISGVNANLTGVWSKEAIPEGTKFGPFQGEKLMTMKKDSDPLCVWEIVEVDTKEFLFYIDASRFDQANWLRYVQCARHFEEQNLIAEQEGIDIMYRAIKPIEKGEELLIWYKSPTTRRGQRQAGRMSEGKAKSIKDLPAQTSSPKRSPMPGSGSPKKKAPKSPRVSQSPLVDSTPNSPLKQKAEEVKEKQKDDDKKLKEDEIKAKQKEEDAKKKQKEEDIKKKQKEEDIKKKQKEEDIKKKQKEEDIKKKQKEEDIKKKQKEEDAKKKQKEEDAKKKQKEEEIQKKLKEQEVIKMKKKEEDMKKQKEEDLKKKKKEQELKKKQKEQEEKRKEEEEEELKEKKKSENGKEKQKEEQARAAEPDKPDLDLDRDSSELEIDLDDGDDDEEEEEGDEEEEVEEEDSDATEDKLDSGKSTQAHDPEKFHFKLKKHHITKSRHGRKVFRCDICSGIYRHAFSLKRHYIRNHINLKYVSRADILNCQINPESQDMEPSDNGVESPSQGSGIAQDSKNGLAGQSDQTTNGPGATRQQCDKPLSDSLHSKTNPDGKDKDISKSDDSSKVNTQDSASEQNSLDQSNAKEKKQLSGLFRCNVCSGIFDTAALLKSHLDNHPNFPSSKAFACDQCDMKFAHKQNLRRHLAVHTGEKPFLCKFCGKTFPTATNQKRHERIHLGRRVACEYCSSTFTQSGDLKKHIRKLHPECFHECAFCGKYFTDEDELVEHVGSHNESIESNEAERHRRRDAFKVDMEQDRIESMKLAEQKTQGIKFACTVCKKRFLDYANMCRHRRLAHQRHLLLGQGSASSSPVPSPTKIASDSSDGDPQAFFYANVANNISENLTSYIEGTKDHIEKTAQQLKWRNQVKDATEKPREIRPKVEADLKDLVAYNFPSGFCLKQNYRKNVADKDRTFDKVKDIKGASNVIDLKVTEGSSDLKVKEAPELHISDTKCVPEVRTVKLVDPNLGNMTKEDSDIKPVISVANGVSLNIPVFNLTNMAKREVKIQPVCTVQPIQRQSQNTSVEPKPVENPVPVQPKKAVAACSDKPSVTNLNGSHQSTALAAVKLVTNQLSKPVTSPPPKAPANKASLSGSKTSPSPASCLALKIPQVHVCSVCRRLFNNDTLFRQHMMDKHKTTPGESQLAQKDKEQKEKAGAGNKKGEGSPKNMDPVMDLSSKPEDKPVPKPIIDQDEGARLLLDFALGIRDEPKKSPCAVVAEQPAAAMNQPSDDQFPLDLSAGVSGPSGSGSDGKDRNCRQFPDRRSSSEASCSSKPSPGQPAAAHGGNRAPVAHSGHSLFANQPGKVQGLLRIPTYHPAKDLDLPAPLVSPPGTPQSPWQPQLPFSLYGPLAKGSGRGNIKKYICTVCYGEFHSRGALLNHQRATHNNVRCDHVEVDNDVVAPWWQKPSPVGMLNVCSSQISEYEQEDQKQFNCTKCKKSFRAVEDLHSHIFECASPMKAHQKSGGPKANKPLPTAPLTSPRANAKVTDAEAEAAEAAAQGLRLLAAGLPRVAFQQHRPPVTVPTQPVPKPAVSVPKSAAPVSKAAAPAISSTAPAQTSAQTSAPHRSTQGPFPANSLKPKGQPTPLTSTSTSATKATTTLSAIPTPTPFTNLKANLPALTATNTTTSCAADSAAMLNRFKTSILKKLKKKKKEKDAEDGLGLMGKKRRRSLELLYNPQNHVRRREMTEVVDMQRCQGCGQRFTTISLLERHIPACEQKDRLKEIQINRNPFEVVGEQAENRNVCRYCGKQFTYTGMLRKHVFEVCQVRKTRLQESTPVDGDWEQELGQPQSGSSSQVDACSNDGSHADDAISVATSTSSTHDAEGAGKGSRRRKRKNRGWGNSKKKRSSTDISHEVVESMWSPEEGDGEGLTIQDEEDTPDNEMDGNQVYDLDHQSVSEAEDTKNESSISKALGTKSKPVRTKLEPVCTNSNLVSTLVDSVESEDELKIDETAPQDNDISTTENYKKVPVISSEPIAKTEATTCIKPSPLNKAKEPPKEQEQHPPLIGRHALPFVLSIPAFRERPPLTTKPKVIKTLPSTITAGRKDTLKATTPDKMKIEDTHKTDSVQKKKDIIVQMAEKPKSTTPVASPVKFGEPSTAAAKWIISAKQGSKDTIQLDVKPKPITKVEGKQSRLDLPNHTSKSPPEAVPIVQKSPAKGLLPPQAVSTLRLQSQTVPKAEASSKTPSIISTIQAVILSASKPLTFEGCDVDGPKKLLTENKIEVKIASPEMKIGETDMSEEARISAEKAAVVASLLREVTGKKQPLDQTLKLNGPNEKLMKPTGPIQKLVKLTAPAEKPVKSTAITNKLSTISDKCVKAVKPTAPILKPISPTGKPTALIVKPTATTVKPIFSTVKPAPVAVKPVKVTASPTKLCNTQMKMTSAIVNKDKEKDQNKLSGLEKSAEKGDKAEMCVPKEQTTVVQMSTESKETIMLVTENKEPNIEVKKDATKSVENGKGAKALKGSTLGSPSKLESTPAVDEESDESSDEEDIKEIINTVLAQRKQGPKQKSPKKQKKQKKVDSKPSSPSPSKSTKASTKAVSKANISEHQDETATKVVSPQKAKKVTKVKTDQDTNNKPTKSKAKKKATKDGEKTPDKSAIAKKKAEVKKTGAEVVKSEGNKTVDPTASPKKSKEKKKSETPPVNDPVSQEPPSKKKKVTKKETSDKDTNDNSSPKKSTDAAAKGKAKAKKGKVSGGQDSTEGKGSNKKAVNSQNQKEDSPAKVQNKNKTKKSQDSSTQEGGSANNEEPTASPVRNRKRKSEPASPKTPKSKETANSKTTSPSPAKLMKTRGGGTPTKSNNTMEENTESGSDSPSPSKTRRSSVRGANVLTPGGKSKVTKSKGKLGTAKAVLPKLKRSVSASVKLATEVLKGRAAASIATSMRTRQSRLSL